VHERGLIVDLSCLRREVLSGWQIVQSCSSEIKIGTVFSWSCVGYHVLVLEKTRQISNLFPSLKSASRSDLLWAGCLW